MTCCIAAICDEGKSIVLVMDKLIGAMFVEAQPDVEKAINVHDNWWVMYAADDISPVFEITDAIRDELRRKKRFSIEEVEDIVGRCYEDARIKRATHRYLKRWKMEADVFVQSGAKLLGRRAAKKLRKQVREFDMRVALIVAGFDSKGEAKLFSIDDGVPQRQDVPGFCAIGSGAPPAENIMMYRGELSYKTPLRSALYYAIEGKYFSEAANGVGSRTDMYVLRSKSKVALTLDEDTIIEDILISKLCEKLEPGNLQKQKFFDILNEIPLPNVPKLKLSTKPRKRKAIPKPKGTRVGNLRIEFPIKLGKPKKT